MVLHSYAALAITSLNIGLVLAFQNQPSIVIPARISTNGVYRDSTTGLVNCGPRNRDAPILFSVVDVQENAVRDIETMEAWAYQCGVQGTEGLQLVLLQVPAYVDGSLGYEGTCQLEPLASKTGAFSQRRNKRQHKSLDLGLSSSVHQEF